MRFDTVLFDLDGTVLDTLDDLADSVNSALESNQYPLRKREEIRGFIGNGIKNLMTLSLPKGISDSEIDRILDQFRSHYSKNMDHKTKPYDGILKLLMQLQSRGVKMAVVSNKYDPAVKALCAKYLGDYIKVAIGEKPGVPRKPAPDGIYEAMEELSAKKEKAVYVGDLAGDILTARNAGVASVGVSWGFGPASALQSAGADFTIDEPMQLLHILEEKL